MRKRLFVTTTIILILVMCMALAVGCTKTKTDWEYIQSKGNIVVGYFDFEPFSYTRGDTKGAEVDIVKAVGEKLGLRVTFQKLNADEVKAKLDDKSVDVVIGGLPNGSSFAEGIATTKSYLRNRQVAVVKKSDSSSWQTIDKINTAKIVAWNGGESSSIIEDQFADASVEYVDSTAKALQKVMSGGADVAIVGDCYSSYNLAMAYYSDLTIVEGLSWGGQDIVMGVRESDTDWLAKLDEILATLAEEGKLAEILAKYNLTNQLNLK